MVHTAKLAHRNGWKVQQFGMSAQGLPLLAWWPTHHAPTRIVWAAIHGEETSTLQVLHQLLRQADARYCCSVVVPVLNPDGVLLASRQNARGVDLNRNFPTDDWVSQSSSTFWPTTVTRNAHARTQQSSSGIGPASEPETQALIKLIELIEPQEAIDIHTPLDLIIASETRAQRLAQYVAAPAGMRIVTELDSPTPGAASTWCRQQGITSITYEMELAPLPQLWHRHSQGLARCIAARNY